MDNFSKTQKLNISKRIVVIKTLPLIEFNKAVYMCKELANTKKIFALWKISDNIPQVHIYTKKENEAEAKYILNRFEFEYMSILRKRNKIVNHRHKNNNT